MTLDLEVRQRSTGWQPIRAEPISGTDQGGDLSGMPRPAVFPPRDYYGCMRGKKSHVVATLVVLAAALVTSRAVAGASATASTPTVTHIVLQAPTAYRPKAPPGGGTDDYHCTLLNPHLKKNAFITSIDFQPNSPEVHHEITYAVPPDLAVGGGGPERRGQGLDLLR